MSTSVAPFAIASFVSNAFVSVVLAPSGKPMTVQTSISVPFSSLAANSTHVGLTQTEANWCVLASSINFQSRIFVYAVSMLYDQ